MENCGNKEYPHAVCVPYPIQGHINPMMNLAKILHSQGFQVTFINTHYNHHRLLRSGGGPNALDGLPTFRFMSIPDGLPEPEDERGQNTVELMRSIELHGGGALRDVVRKLNDENEVPDVTCMVLDVCMSFCLDVASEFGVHSVMLWPAAATCALGFLQYQRLLDLGIIPFKDMSYLTNGELEMEVTWIPGVNGLRLKDLPTFMRITDIDDFFFNYIIRGMHVLKNASFIVFNTFDAIEQDIIQLISSQLPPIYTMGPFKLMIDSIADNEVKTIRSNLWKGDPQCLQWLDSQKHCSVVYVNFGSSTLMTMDQLLEIAWGLADSDQPFLWIIRPDMIDETFTLFSSEYTTKIKNNGFIASWCDQEKVLSHPAIGGFLTHNGWNSTLESIYNGVPMLCWPYFADQQTNCWFCCKKWRIGMEINTNVTRSEVNKQVKELMVGDMGKELRRNVIELKKLAHDAIKIPDGSSYSNLEKAIKILVSPNLA